MDAPSIGMIPSGYKDGKLYSVYPLEGLGEEIITNGNFETNSNWALTSGWSISDGKAHRSGATTNSYVNQDFDIVAGKKYIISYDRTYISGNGTTNLFSFFNNNLTRTNKGNYSSTIQETVTVTDTFIPSHSGNLELRLYGIGDFTGSVDNVSLKEDNSADFDFTRGSLATRVNAQGLVEDVNIISEELTQNGNFDEIGSEEVSNGDFSQIGSELASPLDFLGLWFSSGATSVTENTFEATGSGIGLYFQLSANKIYKVKVSNVVGDISLRYRDGGGAGTIAGNFDEFVYINTYNSTSPNIYLRSNSITSVSVGDVSVVEVGQDWSFANGASIGDDVATIVGDGSVAGYILQNNVFESNKLYKCVFDVTINSGLGLKFQDGLSYNPHNESIGFATTSGVHTFYFNSSTYSQLVISRRTGGTAYDSTINSISIKEVGQNWSFGTGWSMGDGKAVVESGEDGSTLSQDVSVVGKTNKVTFTISDYTGSGFVRLRTGDASQVQDFNANGTYTIYVEPTTATFSFARYMNGTLSIDNVSVKEITDATDLPRLNYDNITWQDALSDELVTNGGFDTDSDWNLDAGWSISDSVAARTDTGTYTSLYQDVLTSGRKYKVTITMDSVTNSELYGVRLGTNYILRNVLSAAGTYTAEGVADSSTLSIVGDVNFEGSVSSISVKEITGQEVASTGCPSLLLEPQSTNLFTYSEDFSQGVWAKRDSTLTSGFTSPSGDSSAYKLTVSAVDGQVVYSYSSGNTNTKTVSVFAKADTTTSKLRIIEQYYLGHRTDFDLNLGVIEFNNSAGAKMEYYGNGWYRCTHIQSYSSGQTSATFALRSATADSFYLWGAQLEELPYASSYIPTNGSVATRLKDEASRSGLQDHINSTEGVLYAEMAALADDGTYRYITLNDGTDQNVVAIRFSETSNQILAFTRIGGSYNAVLSTNSYSTVNFNKIAYRYKSGDFSLFINGTKINSSTSTQTLSANTLNSLSFNNAPFAKMYGKVKDLRVYTTALSDEDLQYLTS